MTISSCTDYSLPEKASPFPIGVRSSSHPPTCECATGTENGLCQPFSIGGYGYPRAGVREAMLVAFRSPRGIAWALILVAVTLVIWLVDGFSSRSDW